MEAIKCELMQLMKEKGYSVVSVNSESADVLCVEIQMNSETRKIFAYVNEDRIVLSEGFSHFDILVRKEMVKAEESVSLEEKVEALEKKVAELEGRVPEQLAQTSSNVMPKHITMNFNSKDSVSIEEYLKKREIALYQLLEEL